MHKLKNYINGKLVTPLDGNYIENIEPATGTEYSLVPDSDKQDVDKAVIAAKKAFPLWSGMPASERSAYLLKIADTIEERLEAFAEAESRDNGKPLSLAREVDIPRAIANFRFFATAILHSASEAHITDQTAINYTLKQPIGIAGCISPWNLPLYLFTWKVAPALAAGCPVIGKPSEVTPMTGYLLAEVCYDIGLPAGVFNIIHGRGPKVGQSIIEHPDIPAISFTGGTATGKMIAATAAPMFKKLSLELGGKNPNIIFADCDFEEALSTTLRSSFSNQGQICLCGSRVLVEQSIYDRFRDELVARTKNLNVGDPMDKKTNVGAVVSEPHMEKVLSYIKLAEEEGGTILTGGSRVMLEGRCADGYFIEPTIIEGLNQQCRTNQEEIFGPVITIEPFSSEEEAITMANSTQYGLAASIWTSNIKRANRMASRVQSGIIWVNCWMLRDLRTPFGGMKQSGVGREGGYRALNFFAEEKNVCIKLD